MRRNIRWVARIAMLAVPLLGGANAERLLFPKDYRKWTHVKTAMITSNHPAAAFEGGLHHIYANSKATDGYVSGRFPDGAAIVYELLESAEKDGVVSEGARRRLDLMVKDSTRFRETGGWGFERFRDRSPDAESLSEQGRAACFACHRRAADHDFVFSRMR